MTDHEAEQGISSAETESLSLGQFLTQCREEKGMTRSQVARTINVSAVYLGKIEQDQAKNPGLLIAYDLAQFYGVDLDTLAKLQEAQKQRRIDRQITELEGEVEEVARIKLSLDLNEVSLRSKELYLKLLSSLASD